MPRPKLQRALQSSGTGYFVGGSLTFVDVYFFYVASGLIEKDSTFLNGAPELQQLFDKVGAMPQMAAYMKSDKRFPAPGLPGYFDRVKASIPWVFGIGETPPISAERWTFDYASQASMKPVDNMSLSPSNAPTTLTYWDGRGNAELIRM